MKKYWIGFFLLVILTSSVYILLPDNVRIDIEKTKTTFQVWENEAWVLAGTERTILFDGTKKMRANSREVESFVVGNLTKVVRTSYFKDNIVAIDTYSFDGSIKNVELYPVQHTVEIINGTGKLFVYEVNDLKYSSITLNNIQSPQSYGHKMKVEWGDGNYYSKIFKYKGKDIGKLTIKYRVETDYKTYFVRLFDPQFEIDEYAYNKSMQLVSTAYGVSFKPDGTRFFIASGKFIQYSCTEAWNLTSCSFDNVNASSVDATVYSMAFSTNGSFLYEGGATNEIVYQHNCGTPWDLSTCSNSGLSIPSPGNNPTGLSFKSDGSKLYILIESGAVVQYTCGTSWKLDTCTFDNTNLSVLASQDLYINSDDGDLFVSGGGSPNIYQYSCPDADNITKCTYTNLNLTIPTGSYVYGMTFSPNGNYFFPSNDTAPGYLMQYSTTIINSPDVTLNYPTNNTNYTTTEVDFNCTVSDDVKVVNVSLMLDGVVNETNSSGLNNSVYNFTKILANGDTYWTCRAADNESKVTTAGQRVISIDTFTLVELIYPETANYTINVSDLNYTIIDAYADYCWYSNDSGVTNSTLQTCMDNWTDVYSIEGFNTWTVFMNDTFGNENYSSVTFTKETELNSIALLLDGIEDNLSIELNTTVNITGNAYTLNFTYPGLVCLDIDHPEYGYNYTCGTGSVTTNLTFDYFRKTTFWNGTTTWNFSDFNLTGDTYFTNETLNFTAHQYDEIDDLRFNISSLDSSSGEDIIFYDCNTTSFDRFYKGFLIGNNIYLNQSVDSSGAVFYNWSNITFDNPGNATVYFAIDDNATIVNISMNATGIDYGFSYFDEFVNFSNIDVTETSAQLHYGPGGFIQSPNSSLILNTLDTFSDASINGANWWYSSTESGDWGSAGVRETSGYLEAYGTVNNGYYTDITKGFYPWANFTWYYTSDSLSFDLDSYSYENEDDENEDDCHETNRVLFGNVVVWTEAAARWGDGDSTNVADMGMNFIKVNNTHWMLNISGTQVRTNGPFRNDCDGTGASVYTYDYSKGLYSVNYTDTECTDTIVAMSNSSIVTVDTDYVIIQVYDGFKVDSSGNCYGNSYIRMDNLKNTMWNRTNGTVVSNSIFDSSSNIISATMNISGYNGANYGNYSFYLYMSANNGVNWESVSNGVEKVFDYPGKHVKWKMFFNTTTPGYQNITSYLENVTIVTPVSNISNVEFDFGNDGTWDYKINGSFGSANDTVVVFMPNADISNAFSSRRTLFAHMYQIPMRIYSASAGQLNLNVFNITYNPNPVIVNSTAIQDFLDDYGSNETNFTIPIAGAGGVVNVSDIKLDYAGGNSTVNITFRDVLNTLTTTKYIYPYYSRWDYMFGPLYVDFLEFIPRRPNSLNVTPYGQTNETPILNLTNYGYGDKNANLSVYLNDTSTCVNLTISTTWNKEDGVQLNNSWNELDSAQLYLNTNNLSMWADYDCDYQNWTLFNPYLYFRQCCDGCACSTEVD